MKRNADPVLSHWAEFIEALSKQIRDLLTLLKGENYE
jgi:hypothetical protein